MSKVLVFLVFSFIAVGQAAVTEAGTEKPNIIFVLADDLGWSELGSYGNKFHETPNLDRLSKTGMRFTQAYAAAPVCSPYRAAFLTGLHPARIGILDYLRPNSSNALSTAHVTLPEILQKNGYTTGMIGKWHLTGYRYHNAEHEVKPTDHGFDWNIGSEIKSVGNGANSWPYVFRDQPVRWVDLPKQKLGRKEYLTDRLNHEAIEFIERNAKQGKPFFLYLSHYAPHSILNGRPDLVKKYVRKHPPGKSGRDRCHLCEDAGLGKGDPGHHWAVDHNPHLAAMLESIDVGIGKISGKLNELGIAKNTIFIFTSDNGGESNVTSNTPLRGGKSELYEGGIRVPLIVSWPNVIPAGTTCDQPTQNMDFYPTLLDAAAVKPDPTQTLDGLSIHESWKNPAQKISRDFLAWHYPLDRPHFLGGVSAGAIRAGQWKLIEHFVTGKLELYSLKNDPGETTDLAGDHPQVAARMRHQLVAWRESVGARIPSPPLLTEARQLYFAEHFIPGLLSERLWYNADWKAEQGVLKRLNNGSGNTRIFLREADYKDVIIRFDFQLGDSKDIRLMTGSGGHYNTVLHIRDDHFYLQTAQDDSVPHFSFRHGECAFKFDRNRWYTMTVELLGNEAVAHIDQKHIVYAKHPMIDRTRDYFALQVDQHEAQFDNLQILNAVATKDLRGRKEVVAAVGRFPVKKSLQEQFEIRKRNAHEWYFQNDKTYRSLVLRVGELDTEKKKRFPDAFRSYKEYKKEMQAKRKKLLESDPKFKDKLFATYRANRKIEQWLIAKKPGLEKLRSDRQKATIAELRAQFAESPELRALIELANQAQSRLETSYPELFVSDQQISARKNKAALARKEHPEFQQLTRKRAAAYRAQQDYLLKTDRDLARLAQQMKAKSPNEFAQ